VDRVTIKPTTLSRELEGETVLVDIDSGTYFGLDEVGTVIWRLIGENVPTTDIPARLTEEFDVDEHTARTDFEALLAELLSKGLVEDAGR